MKLYVAVLLGLLCGCGEVPPAAFRGETAAGVPGSADAVHGAVLREMETAITGAAIVATVVCLLARQGGHIVPSSAPVELW